MLQAIEVNIGDEIKSAPLKWETYSRQELAKFLSVAVNTIHQRIQRNFGAAENKRMKLEDIAHHVCLHDLIEVGLSQELSFKAAKKAAPAVASFVAKYSDSTSFMNLNENRFISVVNKSVLTVDTLNRLPEVAEAHFGCELDIRFPYIAFDCSAAARALLAKLPRHPIRGQR